MLQGPALGAAVAALGLSNKAVYANQVQDSNGGVASGMEGGSYTDGPDLAPNAMPAAVSGRLICTEANTWHCMSSTACLVCRHELSTLFRKLSGFCSLESYFCAFTPTTKA